MNTTRPKLTRQLWAFRPSGSTAALSVSIALVALPSLLHAQTWNGLGGDDNWGTGANWVGGVSPVPSAATDISFGGTTRLTPFNNYTPFDDFRNILFNSGAGAFTLNGSAIDLFGKIENNSTTTQTVNFAAIALNSATVNEFDPTSGDLTINSADIFTNGNQLKIFGNNGKTLTFGALSNISGLGSLAINQNSNVVFQSGHTYFGDTFINAGALQFAQGGSANSSIIRIGDNAINNSPNATVSITDADGGTTVSSILNVRSNLSGTVGTRTISGTNTSGTNTFSGNVAYDQLATVSSNNAGGTLAFTGSTFELKTFAGTFTGSGDTTISNLISSTASTGTLTKTGTGRLTLSGANTYTGATTITTGILRLSGGAAIADAGVIANIAQGALLDLNGSSETIATITASPGSISLGSGALTIGGSAASSITGLVYGTGGSLVKTGGNTLTLGTLQGTGNSTGNAGNLFSGGITLSGGGLTISQQNASGTGLITANGTLSITQPQLLLTGGITINGGTTTLSSTNTAGSGGTLTLNTGGTLAITNNTAAQLVSVAFNGGTFTTPGQAVTFGSLSGTQGFTAGAFGLSFGTNNSSGTYSGAIAGAVASNITKTGSGTQVLSGTNATTGTITANGSGGTLEIGNQYANSTNVAAQSGTLRLNFNTNSIATDVVKSAALSLSGGTLSVIGQNSATNVIQNFTGTTTTAATSSTVSATNGSSSGTTAVNLGAITRGAGSVINFVLPSGTQSATNGILTSTGAAGLFVGSGAQAYTTVNGTDFAAKDGGNTFVQALTGSVVATGGATLTGTPTDNADITGNVSLSAASAINTVRFNSASTLTLTAGALTVTDSGILISSAVTAAGGKITGAGTITSATDVIIHQFSAQPFTLDSAVTGTGVILTKAGPGTLILTKPSTHNGVTYVDSGVLQIGAGGSLQNSVVNLAPNDPTAVFNLNNQTTSVSNIDNGGTTGGYINLGLSGTLNIVGGNSSQFRGALVGGVDSAINKSGAGSQGFNAGNNNAFYGTLTINSGNTIGSFAGSASGFTNANVVNNGTYNVGSGPGVQISFGSLSGSGTITGAQNASTAQTYGVGYLNRDTTFSGVITNGTNATPGLTSISKFGSGTLTLSGNNTYTGTTQINSGGIVFDYSGGKTPMATGSTANVGGGTATFRGVNTGATTINTGTFGFNNAVFSRVVVDSNNGAGTTLNLKTTLVNSVNTLASSSASNGILFDLSSSGSNVLKTDLAIGASVFTASDTTAIRTQNGLLTTGGTANTNYRANVLIKDSTGIGFAQASGTTISRFPTASAIAVPSGSTAMLETTNYRVSNTSVTRTAQVLYNTLELDSSTAPASLTAEFDNFTRLGSGSASVSGRGILATGNNGATLTVGGGINQATYFNNYQTGTTAGQTLTLNMDFFGPAFFNGTGLTVATRSAQNSNITVQSGVLRLTAAQTNGDTFTVGSTGGAYNLQGGILEIGADLSGSATSTSTADFSRSVGQQVGQVQLIGDTGFSAFGGNRTVNLGGGGQTLVWGNDNFLASTAGGTTEGNNAFKLSSAFSDSTIEFQNAIAFGTTTRNVDVANGAADVDARLSGVLSGVFDPTVTLANSAPAVLNAAAGLNKLGAGTLELTAVNTFKGPATVNGGVLKASTAGSLGSTSAALVNSGGTLLLSGAGALNRLNNTAGVTLNAGTLAVSAGSFEGSADTVTGGTPSGSPNVFGLGSLTLSANSTLDFDSLGNGSLLVFNGFTSNGFTLNITNWTNTTYDGTLNSGLASDDRLVFSSAPDLSKINFGPGLTATQLSLGGGYFEIGVSPVPEPTSVGTVMGLFGLVSWRERRRIRQARRAERVGVS